MGGPGGKKLRRVFNVHDRSHCAMPESVGPQSRRSIVGAMNVL